MYFNCLFHFLKKTTAKLPNGHSKLIRSKHSATSRQRTKNDDIPPKFKKKTTVMIFHILHGG